MIVVEIKPHPWGWKAIEGPGVEPVFADKDGAIRYSKGRHRSAEIRVMDSLGNIEETIVLDDPTRGF